MYEFTKKEIRNKFKKTKYGKKVNKMFAISMVIVFIFCFICGFTFGFIDGAELEINKTQENLLNILSALTLASVIVGVYFDGKRDGAIKQFKRTLNKWKE